MYKIKFVLIVMIFSGNIFGQTAIESNSSNFKNGDIYNNFKSSQNTFTISRTFAVDSLGNHINTQNGSSQKLNYLQLTRKADSLFLIKQFPKALNLYIIAFKNNDDRGQVIHRYNAACCYSKINELDNAFIQLFRIAEKGNYYNYIEIQNEIFLEPLKKDPRWPTLIKLIKTNASKIEQKLDSEIPIKD